MLPGLTNNEKKFLQDFKQGHDESDLYSDNDLHHTKEELMEITNLSEEKVLNLLTSLILKKVVESSPAGTLYCLTKEHLFNQVTQGAAPYS